MKTLAIIPARGGSKRIPRKNIRLFNKLPIIAYSIELARKSNLFTDIIVSTDDLEIAEIAKQYGAQVPFLRSPENSNDFAGILEVLIEVSDKAKLNGIDHDAVCCILPTAPLIQTEHLASTFMIFKNGNFDSAFPIVRFSYPIQRSLKLIGSKVEMNWPENYPVRSQDLTANFHDAGQYYFLDIEKCRIKGKIFTDNSAGYEIPELYVQDIDTEIDWKICEFKYEYLYRGK